MIASGSLALCRLPCGRCRGVLRCAQTCRHVPPGGGCAVAVCMHACEGAALGGERAAAGVQGLTWSLTA